MNTTEKLSAAVWETDRHRATLAEALAEWDESPAGDWKALEADRALAASCRQWRKHLEVAGLLA